MLLLVSVPVLSFNIHKTWVTGKQFQLGIKPKRGAVFHGLSLTYISSFLATQHTSWHHKILKQEWMEDILFQFSTFSQQKSIQDRKRILSLLFQNYVFSLCTFYYLDSKGFFFTWRYKYSFTLFHIYLLSICQMLAPHKVPEIKHHDSWIVFACIVQNTIQRIPLGYQLGVGW